MTINEDTGEEVVCPVCDGKEFWDCGHMVASFDLTFGECQGGMFYDHERRFSSIIEDVFIRTLRTGSRPQFSSETLSELWNEAKSNHEPDEEDYVDLDGDILQRVFIELLEEADAFEPSGSLTDPGGPGMTSSISLLFADNTSEVISKAYRNLVAELNSGQSGSNPAT